jgi:AcrR family transcriptional regulator
MASSNRKQQIVQVALDLIDEGGTEAVSTTSIAARIGVSQPAVFRHFHTKEALWLGLLDWLDEQLRQIRAQAVQATDEDEMAALGRMFAHHLDLIAARPALAKLVFSDSLRAQFPVLNARFLQLHTAYEADVERLLRRARSSGRISGEARLRDAIAMYFALIQGVGFQMSISRTAQHAPADRRRIFAMFERALH